MKSDVSADQQAARMAQVERALAQPLEVTIPADFARRIAVLAQAQPQPSRALSFAREVGWGRGLAAASCVGLAAALFGLAPHTVASFNNLQFDLEIALLAELGALGYVAVRFRFRD